MTVEVDLRAAINAVSDVVQNRPRPIREFDQIYMKTGDMVMQSEFVSRWADGKRLAFIGDGDSISVCVAYLHARDILETCPSFTTVFDFDERIVNAVNRFAELENIDNLEARLYNCLDAVPDVDKYDCFYTNPPWGASNNGASVNLFVERGFELIGHQGEGLIVIADDLELDWPKEVLRSSQLFALQSGFYVSRMSPRLHSYHLDDAPDLRSCNLMFASVPGDFPTRESHAKNRDELMNFYGKNAQPYVRYVRDRAGRNRGMARDVDYEFELLD
jgi:predicted methyltransferase